MKIKKELPSLGAEESEMYCICRDRMKKNRTSWSVIGAEALLKKRSYDRPLKNLKGI